MPYRARGKRVMVRRNGKWVLFRVANNEEDARAQAAALNIAMMRREHKGKKK